MLLVAIKAFSLISSCVATCCILSKLTLHRECRDTLSAVPGIVAVMTELTATYMKYSVCGGSLVECYSALTLPHASFWYFISVLHLQSMVVRLFFALGNLTAADEANRLEVFRASQNGDDLLAVLEKMARKFLVCTATPFPVVH